MFAASLRAALEAEFGCSRVQIVTPECPCPELLQEGDVVTYYEDRLRQILGKADLVIADPIYRRITEDGTAFLNLPHEAYSGRMYRSHIPIFLGSAFSGWLEEHLAGDPAIPVNDIMKANRPFR